MLIRFIKQSWLVMLAALVFGLLVAAVDGALKERIDQNAKAKLNNKMQQLLNEAQSFEEVMSDQGEQPLYWVGKGPNGKITGYAIKVSGGGFADKIELLVAFDGQLLTLRGIAVLSSNETPGFGDKIKHESTDKQISFKDQFRACPLDVRLVLIKTGDRSIPDNEIVAISGATISSDAVLSIVDDAVTAMRENITH